jgi:hypothetical protein
VSWEVTSVRWFIGRYFDRFFFSGGGFGGGAIGPGKYLVRSNPSLWLSQQKSVVKASAVGKTVTSSDYQSEQGVDILYHQDVCHRCSP